MTFGEAAAALGAIVGTGGFASIIVSIISYLAAKRAGGPKDELGRTLSRTDGVVLIDSRVAENLGLLAPILVRVADVMERRLEWTEGDRRKRDELVECVCEIRDHAHRLVEQVERSADMHERIASELRQARLFGMSPPDTRAADQRRARPIARDSET